MNEELSKQQNEYADRMINTINNIKDKILEVILINSCKSPNNDFIGYKVELKVVSLYEEKNNQ